MHKKSLKTQKATKAKKTQYFDSDTLEAACDLIKACNSVREHDPDTIGAFLALTRSY